VLNSWPNINYWIVDKILNKQTSTSPIQQERIDSNRDPGDQRKEFRNYWAQYAEPAKWSHQAWEIKTPFLRCNLCIIWIISWLCVEIWLFPLHCPFAALGEIWIQFSSGQLTSSLTLKLITQPSDYLRWDTQIHFLFFSENH
jgi:hypothetical protein